MTEKENLVIKFENLSGAIVPACNVLAGAYAFGYILLYLCPSR